MVAGMEPKQTYYIFYILIPKSVLVFLKFAATLFDDSDFIIALVRNLPTSIFGPCRGKFVKIPHVNYFGTIMDLRISNVEDSRAFPFPC